MMVWKMIPVVVFVLDAEELVEAPSPHVEKVGMAEQHEVPGCLGVAVQVY